MTFYRVGDLLLDTLNYDQGNTDLYFVYLGGDVCLWESWEDEVRGKVKREPNMGQYIHLYAVPESQCLLMFRRYSDELPL